jgi:hypothetical protein
VRLWMVLMELGGNIGFNSSFYVLNFVRNKTVIFLENKESCIGRPRCCYRTGA